MRSSVSLLSQISVEQIRAYKARKSLEEFLRAAWHKVVEPESPLIDNWHLSLICEYLEAVTLGQIRRLLINCPPRYTKSRLVSVAFPCWEWITAPWTKYLFSSYAIELARDHSRERRDILLSDWYQAHWGDQVTMRADQNLITSFGNNLGGMMHCRGTQGVGLGKGANRVIVDDPHNIHEAIHDKKREEAIVDFNTNLSTRLNDKKKDAIIVIMQRVHARDVSAEIERQGGYEQVKIKASPPRDTVYYRFPLSGRVYERQAGEVLCEEREGLEDLERQKIVLGSYHYAALYDQEPAPEGGGRIKIEWFPRYGEALQYSRKIVSVDCANKPSELANHSAWLTFGQCGKQWALIESRKERVNYPDLKKITKQICVDKQADEVMIEDKGNGTALIQELRQDQGFTVPVIAEEPCGDKVVRLDNQTAKLESGFILLPDPDYIKPGWMHDFIQNLMHFPDPAEWDELDAFSQFLRRYVGKVEFSLLDDAIYGDDYETADEDY